MMEQVFWVIATYFIASIPFSVLVGRLVIGKDIRQVGDGNPGATNVMRAGGGLGWYIVALLLDGFKGLFPIGIAYWILGWHDLVIPWIAAAAILGHSFSIYLRFKGGKAIAISGGVWVGLMLIEGLLIYPTMLTFWYYAVEENEWAVTLLMLSVLLYLLLTRPDNLPFLLTWLVNFVVVVYKHRDGLKHLPTMRHRPQTQG